MQAHPSYSHLNADIAATRTADDIRRARFGHPASRADEPRKRWRSAVPWPRRSRADRPADQAVTDCYPRTARA